MKVDVLLIDGNKSGRQVELPEDIFGIEPNEHVLYLTVKQYLNNQRQGTHKTKVRSEVAGSTRKIKRQKGTGTARAGDIKNPLFKGGGTVFGPRPRPYNMKINKKVKSLAKKSALSAKAKQGDILVIEDFTFDAPKTREFMNVLNNLEVGDLKTLFVVGEYDNILQLSSRNIPNANTIEAKDVNPYVVLNANKVLLSESAVNVLSNNK